ncbi:hypothetical protein ABQD97_17090 [Enterococcus avium]|uniref:hypothetical protein n=1 Tax=Enterococcus avium TaxID=33945 RepID=UPI0032E465F9
MRKHKKKSFFYPLKKFLVKKVSQTTLEINQICKSHVGSLVVLLFALSFIVVMNILVFFFFYLNFGESYLNAMYSFSESKIAWCLIFIFILNFAFLFSVRQLLEFSEFSYNITIALINFILVGMTVIILFGQLHNVERITVEDKNEKRYNLLVAKIPHYEVIQNPLDDKHDIILEQKNTYDVLNNLDDNSNANKTLPNDQTKFVKVTRINNRHILLQIVFLISFTAPRLLMPILVKRRKEVNHSIINNSS